MTAANRVANRIANVVTTSVNVERQQDIPFGTVTHRLHLQSFRQQLGTPRWDGRFRGMDLRTDKVP